MCSKKIRYLDISSIRSCWFNIARDTPETSFVKGYKHDPAAFWVTREN